MGTPALSRREQSALRFAIDVTKGVESMYPDFAGLREGEATSDVLSALLARLEREREAAGGYTVRLLPDAPLSDDTEIAFIDGQPFVNAAKHQEVVECAWREAEAAAKDAQPEHRTTGTAEDA